MAVESTPKAGPKTVYCGARTGSFCVCMDHGCTCFALFCEEVFAHRLSENPLKIESRDDIKESSGRKGNKYIHLYMYSYMNIHCHHCPSNRNLWIYKYITVYTYSTVPLSYKWYTREIFCALQYMYQYIYVHL
jgi:hypothetical protein